MTNEEKMRVAIEVAGESLKNGELPVGAVIFRGDEIMAKACSSGEDSAKYLRHAEMKALWEAASWIFAIPFCHFDILLFLCSCTICCNIIKEFDVHLYMI